jgi:hypothetical protein
MEDGRQNICLYVMHVKLEQLVVVQKLLIKDEIFCLAIYYCSLYLYEIHSWDIPTLQRLPMYQ